MWFQLYAVTLRRVRANEREIRAEHAANERALAERDEDMKELRERTIANRGGRSSTGGAKKQRAEAAYASPGGQDDDERLRAEEEDDGGLGGEVDRYRDGGNDVNAHSLTSLVHTRISTREA